MSMNANNVDFHALSSAHIEWSAKTFPNGTADGALIHAGREIQECRDDLYKSAPLDLLVKEYADAFGCLITSADRAGIKPNDILIAFSEKLEINKKRTWRDNGDGSYSHVKPHQQQVAGDAIRDTSDVEPMRWTTSTVDLRNVKPVPCLPQTRRMVVAMMDSQAAYESPYNLSNSGLQLCFVAAVYFVIFLIALAII